MNTTFQESTIKADQDIELFISKSLVDNAKAVIVIVHGINEHSGRYDHVVSRLNEWGYSVYRFDNRAHGKSGGERGFIDSYQLFINDADKIVDLARTENPEQPLFMLGHSMGGFITACYGLQHGSKIDGQILTGAPTLLLPAVEPLKDFNYQEQAKTMLPNDLTDDICRDPDVVKAYVNDPLVNKAFSMMMLGEVFIRGTKWLVENTPSYSCPCLILHGRSDKIVTVEASKNFFDKIASSDKKLKIYDDLYHEIMNEPEKDIVLEDIHEWLDARISKRNVIHKSPQ